MEWNELIETGMKLIQMGCNSDDSNGNCKNHCPFYNYCCEPEAIVDPAKWVFKKSNDINAF